jgi:hypothetical protein
MKPRPRDLVSRIRFAVGPTAVLARAPFAAQWPTVQAGSIATMLAGDRLMAMAIVQVDRPCLPAATPVTQQPATVAGIVQPLTGDVERDAAGLDQSCQQQQAKQISRWGLAKHHSGDDFLV